MESERIGIAGFRSSAGPLSLEPVSLEPVSFEFEGGAAAVPGPGDRGGAAASLPNHPPATRFRPTPRPALPGGRRSRGVPMRIEKSEGIGIAGFRSPADPASPAPVFLGVEGVAAAVPGPGDRGGAAASLPNHPPTTRFRPTPRPALPGGGRPRGVPMRIDRIGIAGFRGSADSMSFAPGALELGAGPAAIVGPNGCGRSGSADPEPPSPDPNPGRRRSGGRSPEGAALVKSR